MPDFEVIYKATADFSSLLRAAAEARTALKALGEEAEKEGTQEATAALKAAAAHDADAAAIKRQARAMAEASAVGQAYNKQVHFAGRSTMDEHMRDVDKERVLQDYLNRSRQRGFMSPQQDYSYRQQELQQRYLWNRAINMGYQLANP